MSRLGNLTQSQRKNLLLLTVCLAQFMVILDISIVNVALPSIRRSLSFSSDGLPWVINAYTLTFAGFLLLGGRASDLFGRKRVFLAGTALFTLASLACALSGSREMLIAARAVQGVGGAVIAPASLAILTTSFAEGAERNRALGVWGAVGGIGGAAGALLGGLLTQGLGWEAVFLINVPVGAGVIAAGLAVVPESRAGLAHRHLDLPGALLVTGGFVALVYGIVRSDALGWGSTGVLAPIGAGVFLLATFLLVEGRFSRAPLMPLSILARRQLRAANLVVLSLYGAVFVMWYFISLYEQQVRGNDAVRTGLEFIPMTLGVALASLLAPRLARAIGPRWALTFGMLLAAVGLLILSGLAPGSSYLGTVLPGGLLSAMGLGFALIPATIIAVGGVPSTEAGLASGLLNTSRLLGGALGLAALTTIANSHAQAELLAGVHRAQALTDGYGLAVLVGAGVCAVGALAAAVLLREVAPGRQASRRLSAAFSRR